MRTTIDLDPVVLAALKERQAIEKKTLSVLVSELLAAALTERSLSSTPSISWPTAPMGARIDIDDRVALWRVLDES
jgi:hypothetical protein